MAAHHEALFPLETEAREELWPSLPLEHATRLLEEFPGAVILLEPNGTVRFLNRIAEDRIDRTRSEVIGRDLFSEVLPELELSGFGAEYRRAMREHPASLSHDAVIRSGSGERPIGLAVRSYQNADVRLALMLIEDRSSLRAESGRRRRAERLAAVGELAAGAAHEINNPLASIKGFAQLLARDTLDRGQQQALEIISQECTRVAQIVDNLLGFASQQQTAERELLDISDLAEGVLSLKRYAFETSGIRIDVELDRRLSRVHAERGALQRLLLVLLRQSEQSLLRLENGRRLQIQTRDSNDGVALHISDNGPAIPRHRLPFLLSPQNEEECLGLSTAEAIAREQGGSLWVESGEGRGTTFTVRLPRTHLKDSEPTAAEPIEPVVEAPAAVRVLVADDEATLRLALSMFLSRHGYEVEQAEDADAAYRIASSQHFDIAFVDVRMPGDGLALLERLEQSAQWKGYAVLMTGDHTMSRVRDEIRGGRAHLIKPFDMMEAVRLIETVTGRPASRTEHQRS